MHLFTVIQLICFGILYAIKSLKTVSIAFPIMVVAIVGIRKIFDFTPKLFSQRELSWLDDIMPQEERKVSFQKSRIFKKWTKIFKNIFRKWMIWDWGDPDMLLKRRIIVRTTKLVGNVECQMHLVLEKVGRKKLFRWKILG